MKSLTILCAALFPAVSLGETQILTDRLKISEVASRRILVTAPVRIVGFDPNEPNGRIVYSPITNSIDVSLGRWNGEPTMAELISELQDEMGNAFFIEQVSPEDLSFGTQDDIVKPY